MPMGLSWKCAHGAPQVRVVLRREVLVDARHHAAPAAGFDQPEDGNQQRAQPDQDELQHLVEDRREQPAQRHVDGHRERRDPDAEVDVPAQHHLHHQRHGIHVDAAHQHRHEAEGDGRRRARLVRHSAVSGSPARSGSWRCSRTASSPRPGTAWPGMAPIQYQCVARMPY